MLDAIGMATWSGTEIASNWIINVTKTYAKASLKVGEQLLVANWDKWLRQKGGFWAKATYTFGTLLVPYFATSLLADKLLGSGLKGIKVAGYGLKGVVLLNLKVIGGIYFFCIKKKFFFPFFFTMVTRAVQCFKDTTEPNIAKAIDFVAALAEEMEKAEKLNPDSPVDKLKAELRMYEVMLAKGLVAGLNTKSMNNIKEKRISILNEISTFSKRT